MNKNVKLFIKKEIQIGIKVQKKWQQKHYKMKNKMDSCLNNLN